jgi:hypothetical protein
MAAGVFFLPRILGLGPTPMWTTCSLRQVSTAFTATLMRQLRVFLVGTRMRERDGMTHT